jgi:hypothetical protein
MQLRKGQRVSERLAAHVLPQGSHSVHGAQYLVTDYLQHSRRNEQQFPVMQHSRNRFRMHSNRLKALH